jgi:hypothetical protein
MSKERMNKWRAEKQQQIKVWAEWFSPKMIELIDVRYLFLICGQSTGA